MWITPGQAGFEQVYYCEAYKGEKKEVAPTCYQASFKTKDSIKKSFYKDEVKE